MFEVIKEYSIVIQMLLMAIAPLLVYRASNKSLTASPYDALAKRVTDLEQKVVALEAENKRLSSDNETLKHDNVNLKRNIMFDRSLIRKLIKLLETHTIAVPKEWYPDWWSQDA